MEIRFFLKICINTCCLLLLFACGSEEVPIVSANTQPTWLIPQDEVLDGGVGLDGIPSLDNPKFDKASAVNPAFDDELVIGVERNGEIHGYPLPIMDWHEIANDVVDDLNIAVTYCPLTGTAIGWDRKLGSTVTTFGVSGLLYNSNLMPYDRSSNSIWSQQNLMCVNGTRRGTVPQSYSLIETSMATWRKSFPDSDVMNANTGFDRQYSFYPYGSYRSDDVLFFPIEQDDRLPLKERVLGVLINDNTTVFKFNNEGQGTDVIHEVINTTDIIVVRSKDDNYNTAFLNPDELEFSPIQDGLPAIMQDQDGNKYDLSGRVIEGPNEGSKLSKPLSFIGFWFSWPAFYPNVEIYNG